MPLFHKPMGWTSENVSKDFNITRKRMDELAAVSHQRAFKAQSTGIFNDEIVPVIALQKPATPDSSTVRKQVLVTQDDGIRAGSSPEALAKIKAAFPQWGNSTTTGGNASQITDGAAGVLLMKRSKAEQLGLPILGKHVATCVAGLAPRIMGIVRLHFYVYLHSAIPGIDVPFFTGTSVCYSQSSQKSRYRQRRCRPLGNQRSLRLYESCLSRKAPRFPRSNIYFANVGFRT